MSCGDHRLACPVALANQHPLGQRHLFRCNLYAEIAPGHHYGIRGGNDLVNIAQARTAFNLGHHMLGSAGFLNDAAHLFHMLSPAHKGGGNKVYVVLDPKADVFNVFLGECRQVHIYAGQRDAFAGAQFSAHHYLADHIGTLDFLHPQL